MASAKGAQIRAIASTAVQETLRRKVLWIVVFLLLIIGVFAVSGMALMQMAADSGEAGMLTAARSGLITTTLSLWNTASQFLALFLGAVALSSEVSSKTIVNVLSRPVERGVYLTGRWLGLLAFLWAFQAAGELLAFGMMRLLGVSTQPMFWLGLLEVHINIALLSGASLALSVLMPPVVAGGLVVILPLLAAVAKQFTSHPNWLVKVPTMVIYYLMPAQMPVNLITDSLSKELLDPRLGLYGRVLGENVLYALVIFAAGCYFFAKRELRLR